MVTSFDIDHYTSDPFYNQTVKYALYFCVFVFFTSIFVDSPYGKLSSSKFSFGLSLNSRLGWCLMEIPAPLSFLITFFFFTPLRGPVQIVFLCMWCVHYANRAFIFPYTMRTNEAKSTFSLLVIVVGWGVTTVHGYLHAMFIGKLGPHMADGKTWLEDVRFQIGFVMYYVGFFMTLHCEHIQRNLRTAEDLQRKEKVYKIPVGGLFDYVSAAPYTAELFAWFGFMVCSWSLAGVFIFSISCANLIPRAFATHAWYKNRFGEKYPSNRKALIPFII